jgi:diadenosine tetraphosphate (Ap4A) HIT family hydrolase
LSNCPICAIASEDAWVLTEFVVAIPHTNPLTSCHVIVAPRRHVGAFYDLDVQEQRMIWDTLALLRTRIKTSLNVEGFDVGFADAPPNDDGAGHAFVHLIPRIAGESYDKPRGVEWVDLGSQ